MPNNLLIGTVALRDEPRYGLRFKFPLHVAEVGSGGPAAFRIAPEMPAVDVSELMRKPHVTGRRVELAVDLNVPSDWQGLFGRVPLRAREDNGGARERAAILPGDSNRDPIQTGRIDAAVP
jgi:hypothetical protein